MQEINRFICRGISKETGEFVYGYYVFLRNRHFIISQTVATIRNAVTGVSTLSSETYEREIIDRPIEIIQEPDRFSNRYSKDGKPIFKGDRIEDETGNIFICDTFLDRIYFISEKDYISPLKDISVYSNFKIISNTHNIKENL